MTQESFVAKLYIQNDLRPFYLEMANSLGMELSHYFMELVVAQLDKLHFQLGYTNQQVSWSELSADNRADIAQRILKKKEWNFRVQELDSSAPNDVHEEQKRKRDMLRIQNVQDSFSSGQVKFPYAENDKEVEVRFSPSTGILLAEHAMEAKGLYPADYILTVAAQELSEHRFHTNNGIGFKYRDMTVSDRNIARRRLESESPQK